MAAYDIGAVRQHNADGRRVFAGARGLNEGSPAVEQFSPLSGVLGGGDFSLGFVQQGWPEKQAVIAPLATNSRHNVGKISNVELLGFKGKVQWTQDEAGLSVQLPTEKPSDHAIVFKLTGTNFT